MNDDLIKAEAAVFLRWMEEREGYVATIHDPAKGEWYGVKRLLFHWTLIRGTVGNYEGYEDRWCYQTRSGADDAMMCFAQAGFEGEPQGWHRHPSTGRRRENGDPARETIRW